MPSTRSTADMEAAIGRRKPPDPLPHLIRKLSSDIHNRYNSADKTCQRMYEDYQKQQKRLGQIRIELNELNELL